MLSGWHLLFCGELGFQSAGTEEPCGSCQSSFHFSSVCVLLAPTEVTAVRTHWWKTRPILTSDLTFSQKPLGTHTCTQKHPHNDTPPRQGENLTLSPKFIQTEEVYKMKRGIYFKEENLEKKKTTNKTGINNQSSSISNKNPKWTRGKNRWTQWEFL